MDFVLVLHSHLPFVLGHGRWPHGSDWLMEAAIDCYLPLLETLNDLDRECVSAPVTLGVTPVLAAQLAMPEFAVELRAFLAQRLAACDEAERELGVAGEHTLAALVRFWRDRYRHLSAQFDSIDADIVGELRKHESAGRIEIMSSAATHGFLPLLARDESVRLQLFAGLAEHKRLFGRMPAGCWLPECAYRPAGDWSPWEGGPTKANRDGIETHLESAGYQYVVIDSHLAHAGRPLEAYHKAAVAPELAAENSPYRDYTIGSSAHAVHALVRDPASTHHVWSRDHGYPGAGAYLEFHKIRFPGGLKLWEVTGSGVSLGGKQPYDPPRARALARDHAQHFAGLLNTVSRDATAADRVIVAPFDSELFGHWWFEGPDFIGNVFRALRNTRATTPKSAGAHVKAVRAATPLDLPAGSWGRDGNFNMWLNEQTVWTWKRLWPLEERFWDAAPAALALPAAHLVLAQAARELLLAQSSDWQFIISTGEVADYAERRFRLHVENAEMLVGALERGEFAAVGERAADLQRRDSLFPDVLDSVARALLPVTVAA